MLSFSLALSLPCTPGKAGDTTGCKNCIAGQFQNLTTQTICLDCERGKIASEGSALCQICAAGKYVATKGSNVCFECPQGWKRDELDPPTSCQQCNIGKKAVSKGSTACQTCAAGKYVATKGRGICSICPVGWISDNPAAVVCTECKQGLYTSNESLTSGAGAGTCQNCDLGKYGHVPGKCNACLPGTYNDAKGTKSCNPCPVDTFYSGFGATALSQCEFCPEDRTTGIMNSSITNVSCLCKQNDYYQSAADESLCLKCPDGGECPIDGSKLMHIYAKSGFWLPNNETEEIIDCGDAFSDVKLKEQARERCCPITINGTICDSVPRQFDWITDNQCEPGYSGPLCVACASTHVLYNSKCIECDGGSPLWVGIVGLCGVAFVFFLVALVSLKTTTKSQEHVKETRITRLTGMLSIIISWLQILSALTVTYKMAWPPDFATYSQGTGAVVNLEIMSMLAISSCQLAVPFINKFLLQIITPPLLVFAVFAAWLILKCIHGKQKGWKKVQKARTEQAQSLVVVVIQLLYPKLATRTFQMFRCVDLGPKIGSLLDADFSKKCFDGIHAEYVPFAIFSVAFYLVGLPLGTFIILFINRKKLDLPHIESKYGDLYRQYEADWYFWECLLMLQKCFLTGAMVAIAPGSPIQLLVALLVCMFYLLLVLHAEPYKGDIEDRLAFLTSLSLSISLLLGLAIITDKASPNNVFDLYSLGVVLISINVLPFMYVIYAAIEITKHGPNVGISNGSRSGSSRSGNPTHVTRGLLTRQKSFSLIVKEAVNHDTAIKLQTGSAEARNAAIKKINRRRFNADKRVRQRLSQRRKKRLVHQNSTTKVIPVLSSEINELPKTIVDVKNLSKTPVHTATINTADPEKIDAIRLAIQKKVENANKLQKIYKRLDSDHDGYLSKMEFRNLIAEFVKPSPTKIVFQAIWNDACHLRKAGDGIKELDLDTLTAWIFQNNATKKTNVSEVLPSSSNNLEQVSEVLPSSSPKTVVESENNFEQVHQQHDPYEGEQAGPWTAHLDPASGHFYYLHGATHETVWERPPEYAGKNVSNHL